MYIEKFNVHVNFMALVHLYNQEEKCMKTIVVFTLSTVLTVIILTCGINISSLAKLLFQLYFNSKYVNNAVNKMGTFLQTNG